MRIKKTLLSAGQLAALLDISEFTVKKLAAAKEIPSERIKGRILFNMDKILAYFRKLEGGAA